MSKSKETVVSAYAPGPAILKGSPHLSVCWLVPCPYCGGVHVHGAGEGRRAPHCPKGPDWLTAGWERPPGSTLKFAGVIDDPKIFKAASISRKDKYKAYLKTFADKSKARDLESRSAFRALQKRPATTAG